ncbi:hypothetical protein BH23ACT9_BH23ACT9_00590 [soil metagenome]
MDDQIDQAAVAGVGGGRSSGQPHPGGGDVACGQLHAMDADALARSEAAQWARRSVRHWRDDVSGMGRLQAFLPGDVYDALLAGLARTRTVDGREVPEDERRTTDQREADALIDLVDTALRAGQLPDRTTSAVMRSIVSLSHEIGATVIAEGVETVEQLQAVRGLGVDWAQGWYFARANGAAARQPDHRPSAPRRPRRLARVGQGGGVRSLSALHGLDGPQRRGRRRIRRDAAPSPGSRGRRRRCGGRSRRSPGTGGPRRHSAHRVRRR